MCESIDGHEEGLEKSSLPFFAHMPSSSLCSARQPYPASPIHWAPWSSSHPSLWQTSSLPCSGASVRCSDALPEDSRTSEDKTLQMCAVESDAPFTNFANLKPIDRYPSMNSEGELVSVSARLMGSALMDVLRSEGRERASGLLPLRSPWISRAQSNARAALSLPRLPPPPSHGRTPSRTAKTLYLTRAAPYEVELSYDTCLTATHPSPTASEVA